MGLAEPAPVENDKGDASGEEVGTRKTKIQIMDHDDDDVTQNCDFLCFSLKQNFISIN